jgi:hypothetical protein
MLLALSIATAIPIAVAWSAEDLPYLYDQLKKPAYRGALEAALRTGKRLPPWIGVFMKTMNGVATPGNSVVVEGQTLELYAVCEPHNCGGNFLYALFEPGGGRAWALVTKDGQVLATLGSPSAAQRQALMAATKS